MRLKKLNVALAAMLISIGMTASAMAVTFGIGFSGGGTHVDATGTEVMNTSSDKSSAQEEAASPLGTVWAQVIVGESYFGEGNGFAIGYDHFFGETGFEAKERLDASDTQKNGKELVNITQYAKAHLSDLNTIFIETPGFTPLGIYLKAGLSSIDVTTSEELPTGGSYGNAGIDGTTYGFGFKKASGGMQVKTEFNYTDWDDLRLNNGNAGGDDAGGANYIDVDMENWAFKFSIGYNF